MVEWAMGSHMERVRGNSVTKARSCWKSTNRSYSYVEREVGPQGRLGNWSRGLTRDLYIEAGHIL